MVQYPSPVGSCVATPHAGLWHGCRFSRFSVPESVGRVSGDGFTRRCGLRPPDGSRRGEEAHPRRRDTGHTSSADVASRRKMPPHEMHDASQAHRRCMDIWPSPRRGSSVSRLVRRCCQLGQEENRNVGLGASVHRLSRGDGSLPSLSPPPPVGRNGLREPAH